MGDHADDALNQMLDDLEAWENGEYDQPPEDDYPMFHPWWGDAAVHRQVRTAKVGDRCPRCSSGSFVLRTNGRTKKQFLGCSRFPNCKCTAEIARSELEQKRALEEYDRERNPEPDVPSCELFGDD